jgi:hypothetical protein
MYCALLYERHGTLEGVQAHQSGSAHRELGTAVSKVTVIQPRLGSGWRGILLPRTLYSVRFGAAELEGLALSWRTPSTT